MFNLIKKCFGISKPSAVVEDKISIYKDSVCSPVVSDYSIMVKTFLGEQSGLTVRPKEMVNIDCGFKMKIGEEYDYKISPISNELYKKGIMIFQSSNDGEEFSLTILNLGRHDFFLVKGNPLINITVFEKVKLIK